MSTELRKKALNDRLEAAAKAVAPALKEMADAMEAIAMSPDFYLHERDKARSAAKGAYEAYLEFSRSLT